MELDQAMAELEEIVRRLELGEVPLGEAGRLYQRGMELYRACQVRLDEVERQLEQLDPDTGQLTPVEEV